MFIHVLRIIHILIHEPVSTVSINANNMIDIIRFLTLLIVIKVMRIVIIIKNEHLSYISPPLIILKINSFDTMSTPVNTLHILLV